MSDWRKTVARIGRKSDPPSPLVRVRRDEEPIFVCDVEETRGVLRLKRGKWAGRTWAVRLHCCDNPLCGCANVDFHCIDADHEGSEPPEILHFGLDPGERLATPDTGRGQSPSASDLAKAVVAEFSDKEWRCVYEFLLTTKREIVRTMDVAKLPAPDSPDDITQDGSLVGFGEIFPFAECFEFELGGEHWAVDDQYCVMPDCDCREVVLSFLDLIPSRDASDAVKEPAAVARYDYKRNKLRPECKPAADRPSLNDLLGAMREAHPSFVQDVRRRHKQMKTLYLRAMVKEANENFSPGVPVTRPEPKIGRNDPCSCGSGRKYKNCCGR